MKRLLISSYGMKKNFQGQELLKDFWIELREGSVVGLCGMNQSGKSLAARILTGEIAADAGKIYIEDTMYTDPAQAAARLRVVSKYMGRESMLFNELTIAENYWILCNKPAMRTIRRADYSKISQCLKSTNFVGRANVLIGDLPFGIREYCEILLVILSEKRLIILDEKLDALYRWNIEMAKELLKQGRERNCCFLIISNNLQMLRELCGEIGVLRNGVSVIQISPQKYNQIELVQMMAGENDLLTEPVRESHSVRKGKLVFRAEGFRLGRENPELDFQVYKNEIVGILSLNNRWNNLITETLSGKYKNFYGSLYLSNRYLSYRSLRALKNGKDRLCVLPDPVWKELLFSCMSIEDNLLLPSVYKIIGSCLGYTGKKMTAFARGQLIEDGCLSERQIREMKIDNLDMMASMKLVMERIRVYRPELLVVSGLTASADVHLRKTIFQECRNLVDRGISILVISSDIQEVLALCSRIILVKDGSKVCEMCINGTENPTELMKKL